MPKANRYSFSFSAPVISTANKGKRLSVQTEVANLLRKHGCQNKAICNEKVNVYLTQFKTYEPQGWNNRLIQISNILLDAQQRKLEE